MDVGSGELMEEDPSDENRGGRRRIFQKRIKPKRRGRKKRRRLRVWKLCAANVQEEAQEVLNERRAEKTWKSYAATNARFVLLIFKAPANKALLNNCPDDSHAFQLDPRGTSKSRTSVLVSAICRASCVHNKQYHHLPGVGGDFKEAQRGQPHGANDECFSFRSRRFV